MEVQSLGQEDPLEEAWQPTPVFLPGKPHGQRSLVGYSPWGYKEPDMTEQLSTQELTSSSGHTKITTIYKATFDEKDMRSSRKDLLQLKI